MRWSPLSPLLSVLPSLLFGAPLLAPSPAAADVPAGIEVSLKQKKRNELRLLELVWDRKEPGIIGLDGALEVRVSNRGGEPVAVVWMEVHGLLFVNVKTREQHVMIHPCQCARDYRKPARTTRLAPGESETFSLDDFGCGGGMWKAPGPGQWEVTYRVPVGPAGKPWPQLMRGADVGSDILKKIARCKELLRSDRFWSRAVSSPPIRVRLRKPRKKRI